jgi:predicted Zn-dependent protease
VKVGASDLKAWGDFGAYGLNAVKVARLVLEGRAAMLEDKPKVAAKAFRKAAELEESRLADQTDPPIWWYPTRRSLAAALLASGDARGAAEAARAAIAKRPLDPISLSVLAQAERKLGLTQAADSHAAQARKGFVGDVTKIGLAQS